MDLESLMAELEAVLGEKMQHFVGRKLDVKSLHNIQSTLDSLHSLYKGWGFDLPEFDIVTESDVITIKWKDEEMSASDDLMKENGNVGFQKTVEQNLKCEHRVVVSREEYGKNAKVELGVTFPEQDCPFCIRRWMHYWRNRAESAGI